MWLISLPHLPSSDVASMLRKCEMSEILSVANNYLCDIINNFIHLHVILDIYHIQNSPQLISFVFKVIHEASSRLGLRVPLLPYPCLRERNLLPCVLTNSCSFFNTACCKYSSPLSFHISYLHDCIKFLQVYHTYVVKCANCTHNDIVYTPYTN